MRRSSRNQRSIVFLAVILLAGACVGSKRRVAFMGIKGPNAPKVDGTVTSVVKTKYALVGPRTYWKTARRIKARGTRNKDIARVASRLKVDAVVHGQLLRRGKRSRKRFLLRLSLRDGRTGRVVGRIVAPVSRKKLNRASRRKLARRLLAALERLSSRAKKREIALRKAKEKAARKSEKITAREEAAREQAELEELARADEEARAEEAAMAKEDGEEVAEEDDEDSPSLDAKYGRDGQAIDDEDPTIP